MIKKRSNLKLTVIDHSDWIYSLCRDCPSAYRADLKYRLTTRWISPDAHNLDQAFTWDDQPEEYEFWRLINDGEFEGAYESLRRDHDVPIEVRSIRV